MRKITLIVLLFALTQSVYAVAVSTGSAAAIGAASGAAAASMSSQKAAQEAANQSMLVNVQSQVNSVATGLLICNAVKQNLPDSSLNISMCKIGGIFDGYYLSIQDFFNRNKPTSASKITMVIYDRQNQEFQIYYN